MSLKPIVPSFDGDVIEVSEVKSVVGLKQSQNVSYQVVCCRDRTKIM